MPNIYRHGNKAMLLKLEINKKVFLNFPYYPYSLINASTYMGLFVKGYPSCLTLALPLFYIHIYFIFITCCAIPQKYPLKVALIL